jgi:hypothetical protein
MAILKKHSGIPGKMSLFMPKTKFDKPDKTKENTIPKKTVEPTMSFRKKMGIK